MSEFPPRYPPVPALTTNRTPVGNTDANQKPMLIYDFSTNEPPLSWMMFEQANLRKRLVELNSQLAEAKAENERLRKVLQQITELSPFKFNTGNASIQYITQMLVKMTALAHEALKEKE